MLDENLEKQEQNLENKDTLHPIQEEDQEKSESYTTDYSVKKDICGEDEKDTDEDTKYQFPDTQIKIDLSGPK